MLSKGNSHEDTIEILKGLNKYVSAVDVTKEMITLSLNSSFNDFEDALQYYAAVSHGNIIGIVTRNGKDFKPSEIAILNPEQALALIS